jgi:hypothetical protein
MSKDGVFKGDSPDKGHRLRELRDAGLTALQRRYVDIEAEAGPGRKEVRPMTTISPNRVSRAPDVAGGGRSGPRGGRPRLIEGEPWVAEGISRRTWERRKKGAGG